MSQRACPPSPPAQRNRVQKRAGRLLAALALLSALGCRAASGSAHSADSAGTWLPDKARSDAAESRPRVASAPTWSFPALAPTRLGNGLSLLVLERPALPLLELRLAIAGGSASDGERPGTAALTLEVLELLVERAAERGLAARVESLGGQLQLETRRDASVVALTLPSAALEEGLAVLAALTAPPAWAPAAFEVARARALGRARARQANPAWLAERALYAELFRASSQRHPYGCAEALPSELQRLTLEELRSWHESHFSPRNASLIVVGGVSPVRVSALVERALGAWQDREVAGREVAGREGIGREGALPVGFTATAPSRLKTLLVHRAGAKRSELRVAALGPERTAADWPAFAAAQQVLGGAESSRLRRELTRRGELDVELSSSLVPVAHGSTPLVIAANAETERTALTLAALLDSLTALAGDEPARRELFAARQQLAASLPRALETNAAAAELLLQSQLWGLAQGALDERQRFARVTAKDVLRTARRYLSAPPVVVVVGDAERLLTPLSHFGQVDLLDAEDDLRLERVVSQDPTAPLEGPNLTSSRGAEGLLNP